MPDETAKRDFRQEVTDSIVEMLEKGTSPWQKPWDPQKAFELPFNPESEKAYRGGNALHLMAVGAQKNYADPRWLTYRQAQENGWQVRKGEKGTHIEFWQFNDERAKQHADCSEQVNPTEGRKEDQQRGHADVASNQLRPQDIVDAADNERAPKGKTNRRHRMAAE